MLDAAAIAEIRRLHYAEHWKVGTIASQLDVHPDAVRRALRLEPGARPPRPRRRRQIDAFVPWLRETLERYPRLRATVLHRMARERGFGGSVSSVRREVREIRPRRREVFVRLSSFPGEVAQVDWADFGAVRIGRAVRRLSAFVMTLCHSRALYIEFFFDQRLANFLRAHARAFEQFAGVTRQVTYDFVTRNIIVKQHPRAALPGEEGGLVAAEEVLHPCAEEKAQKDLTRPAQDHDEGQERTPPGADPQLAEARPIHLALFAAERPQAEVGFGSRTRPVEGNQVTEVVLAADVTALPHHLVEPGRGQRRIGRKGRLDERHIGFDLRGPAPLARRRNAGVHQHSPHGGVVQVELTGDRVHPPLFSVVHPQHLRFKFGRDHHALLFGAMSTPARRRRRRGSNRA
jgi:transposase